MILSFEKLVEPLTELPMNERMILSHAYEFAREAHKNQKRKSGEDYFLHCAEVARILVDLKLDVSTVAAALLHDVVEDTSYTIEDLEEEFGEEIAGLVSGVTKLDQLPLRPTDNSSTRPRDREAEYLRKTLLAMNDDVRVILIKLADRLHNMRTLGHMSQESQQRNARETRDIFAPLASRLGIWQMKWELEDLSFRYLEPDLYKQIANMIAKRRDDRDKNVTRIVDDLEQVLRENNIEAEVSGRSKHIFSIYRKMDSKGLPFDQIYDVRAARVLVKDKPTCYQVLGIIHATWRPIAGEFDDYIAAPKDNFYQSLHTAVLLDDGLTLEVQIRSREMHEHAEYGIAAHWRYKEGRGGRDEAFERRIKHLRELMEFGHSVDDADEFLDVMRTDVFQDRVYVFTPRGDIIDLPNGSTPIDFAYMIHTEIGHRCRGAKVNGKLVPLDYTLQVGDRVDVLTAKRGGPSRDWLNPNLAYVETKRAASKIKQWFRRQDREKMIALGHEILDRELNRLGEEKMSHEQVAKLLGLDKPEDLLEQLGFGDIHPQNIASRILEMERRQKQELKTLETLERPPEPLPRTTAHGVTIHGTGGLLTQLGRCCNPVQGDDIVGYITRGRGVTIHRKDCANILSLATERLITVEWGKEEQARYPVPVIVSAYDREGLMRDIGTAVAEEHINMLDVSIRNENHFAIFNMVMEVESAVQLSRILEKIERLPNVMEVRRITS